uniref:Uncharacterized protein n=1 Tax=Cacopsylla melanoneura TaxID=428564 RepID=A0A8D8ZHK6_9HEMI
MMSSLDILIGPGTTLVRQNGNTTVIKETRSPNTILYSRVKLFLIDIWPISVENIYPSTAPILLSPRIPSWPMGFLPSHLSTSYLLFSFIFAIFSPFSFYSVVLNLTYTWQR